MLDLHDNRPTIRLLRLLAKGPAILAQSAKADLWLVDCGDRGTLTIEKAALNDAVARSMILRDKDQLVLAPEIAAHMPAPSRAASIVETGETAILVEINAAESPLAQLYRRRDRRGRPFLDRAEFEAGEQLRADYTRACLMPKMTQSWSGLPGGGRNGDGTAHMAVGTLAARKRVEKALDAIGPELSGPLLDICCFLKGFEQVESERGWPVRSAKVMLKAGLSALARHYAPMGRPKMRHWGADGYRPEI